MPAASVIALALALQAAPASVGVPGAAPRLERSAHVPAPFSASWRSNAPAQPGLPRTEAATLRVRGRVVSQDGSPIAGAAVDAPRAQQGTTTDANGSFQLELPPGLHDLVVQRLDHVPIERRVEVGEAAAPLEFRLALRDLRVPTTRVSARRLAEPPSAPGRYLLRAEDVEDQIGNFEDILRSVQSLPSVGRASDYHGEFFLRGAGAHANAVYLDGIPIFFPYHILGFNSIFNPGIVESAEVFAGGPPAAYGGGTGGILLLRSRSEPPAGQRGSFGLSYMSGHVQTGGSHGERSWVLSLRRSHHDQIARLLGSESSSQIPTFHDAMLRLRWRLSERHQLFGGLLRAGDGMSIDNPEAGAVRRDLIQADDASGSGASGPGSAFETANDRLGLDNRLTLGSVSWHALLGESSFMETTLGFAPQRLRFSLHGENDASLDIDTQLVSLRSGVTWHRRGHRLQFGCESYRTRTTGFVSAYASFLNLRLTNSALNLDDQPERYQLDVSSVRTYGALYAQDDWPLWSGRLELSRGVRYERDNLTGEDLVSPRLGFTSHLGQHLRLHGTWGVYNTLRNTPMEVQPTSDGRPLGAEKATETTLGLVRDGEARWKAGMTAYHKRFSNLVYESEPAYYANGGEGWSHGIESWLETAPLGPFRARLQYAWSRTRQRDATAWRRRLRADPGGGPATWGPVFETPYWYSPIQDQRHHLGLEARLVLGAWELGTQLQLASGLPYTPVHSVVEDADGKVYGIVGRKGSARLPAYRRLDFRVLRHFGGDRLRWRLVAEILNATAAQNVYMVRSSRDYTQQFSVTMLPFLPTLGVEFSY